ncbi:hypothetical protein [Desulfospira joergensenii]|uniref:hypothetical protein n=1 Tax=Desulfospira joergensenii TaxID=53329 RepID=UPI0003B4D9FD|nr:hypothetical protein [Desulfospira joergensenii]
MAVSEKLEYFRIDDLFLDPLNPRLGRHRRSDDTPVEKLLEYMSEQVLDELALSYIESGGFWSQEPLLAVHEPLYGEMRIVVVEGNRRLATLKTLQAAVEGKPFSGKWKKISESAQEKGTAFLSKLFSTVPVLIVESRSDIDEFLGFRHVTGIKQWAPAEKAQFIDMLLTERKYSYIEVMKKIGSKTPTVRQYFIAYRLLLQIEDSLAEEELPKEQLEYRFSLLYSSLSNPSVQNYLGIDLNLTIDEAKVPVKKEHLDNLKFIVRCFYGDGKEKKPLVTDTRQLPEFGEILDSEDAIDYINTDKKPDFTTAYEFAGGAEKEIERSLHQASVAIRSVLNRIHYYKKSPLIRQTIKKLKLDSEALLINFSDIDTEED